MTIPETIASAVGEPEHNMSTPDNKCKLNGEHADCSNTGCFCGTEKCCKIKYVYSAPDNKIECKHEYLPHELNCFKCDEGKIKECNDIAEFWLSKLDACKSSLLERAQKMIYKKHNCWDDGYCTDCQRWDKWNEAVSAFINLIKEGKE